MAVMQQQWVYLYVSFWWTTGKAVSCQEPQLVDSVFDFLRLSIE